MALPRVATPTYELNIPSTKEKVKFRPFLVKEEKILLMAQESGQPNVFVDAITQVLNNCVVDYDVSKLTMEIILQFNFFVILTASKTSALSPL